MKNLVSIALIVLFNGMSITSGYAKVKLPAIVSSNMVLQRNTTITIWGWADPNENIDIKPSWNSKPLHIKADKHGDWRITIKTTNSKDTQSILITSKESHINLENILFGEVWLCSGQSNMYQPLKGYTGQPTFGGNMAIATSKNSNLRLFSVDKKASKTPLNDLTGHTPWQEATPNNVNNFSAVAFFFGQQLQHILDVPVGLIHTSWGGSTVQAWISDEVLSGYKKVNLTNVNISKSANNTN